MSPQVSVIRMCGREEEEEDKNKRQRMPGAQEGFLVRQGDVDPSPGTPRDADAESIGDRRENDGDRRKLSLAEGRFIERCAGVASTSDSINRIFAGSLCMMEKPDMQG